ncbi:PEP-CTERM sorting domain-containing protein [Alteromonas pelagimontana]|uniref:PEP-CTERM sorting domain-containing protein n=1 Tax=Alteromonas pelagimontana TaxID=1858656 RepID=A0A6M4MBG3_9ALTE|nr:PEP-CTERM sorting domain-containing protein [Alteromonas pelagimontana]QJR79940.1 PEP-CTERM sorting domain-containing protein [Alteromonas pelagimontana]
MRKSIKATAIMASLLAATSVNADVIQTSPFNFDAISLTAHSTQNHGNYFTSGAAGEVLSLTENTWVGVNLADAFGISALNPIKDQNDYVLNFDFKMKGASDSAYSEIAGIWLADYSKSVQDNDSSRTFELAGTQTFGLQDFNYTNSGTWQTFSIMLGEFTSGNITDVIFINDCDNRNGCGDMNVSFKGVSISEVSEPTAMALALFGIGLIGWRTRRQ